MRNLSKKSRMSQNNSRAGCVIFRGILPLNLCLHFMFISPFSRAVLPDEQDSEVISNQKLNPKVCLFILLIITFMYIIYYNYKLIIGCIMGKKRRAENKETPAPVEEPKKVKTHLKEVDIKGQKDVVKHIKKQEKRLIVVLESANLETVKFGKGYGLLNVDEHSGILKKLGRDFSSARPDITHQCLLMLLDSPLNRAGLLQVHFKAK